jgi:hypothetical protein
MRFSWIALAVVLLLLPSHARAQWEDGHVSSLPRLTPGAVLDAVQGAPPGPAWPRGTVIVAASLEGRGPTLFEWDVARGHIMRQASLGLPPSDVRLARAGSTLEVLATGRSVVLSQVDLVSFRLQHRVDLGAGTYSRVVTDGALTVVAANPRYDQPLDTWMVWTVDGAGHVLGRRSAPGTLGYGSNVQLAVLQGRAFLVLSADPPVEPKARLVALNADATVARQIVLDTSTALPSIAVKGDRLLVAERDEILEVSSQLDILAHHAVSVRGMLAVSSDGRVFAENGVILSNEFLVERRGLHGEPWTHAMTWVGSTLVAVGTDVGVETYARLHWWGAAPP